MRNPLRFLTQKKMYGALEPDEIFIDSQNLPEFDTAHLEGRLERPLAPRAFQRLLGVGVLIGLAVLVQTGSLDIIQHQYFATWAEENHLRHESLIAERGRIIDRNGIPLAANASESASSTVDVPERVYPLGNAAAQLVGYVSYPKRDQNGNWYQEEIEGIAGAEQLFDDTLRGENGDRIAETNAEGKAVSGSVVRDPLPGKDVVLSIDGDLQKAVYAFVKERVDASFVGGAATVMDVQTGELLALVSYPSFDPSIMSSGTPKETVQHYIADSRSPFVDRAVVGLYTPGSIVKPVIASAALAEGVVTPEKTFVSTGKLVLPNPYNPDKPSIFKDWRANGVVDMRRAIAVSSDVYFYIVGGGFENQRGLGISAIDAYAKKFGFGTHTGFPEEDEPTGTVPSPQWKADHFNGDVWRVGDTYNTSIGQYGWQVTLLQAVRAVSAIANGGTLVTPTVEKDKIGNESSVGVTDSKLQVVREGMRDAVTDGIAQTLSTPGLHVAAKTGTAEVGVQKELTNSLVIGFFPYEHPRYAFAVILEHSKAGTLVGAPAVMHNVLTWIVERRPDMASPTVTLGLTQKYDRIQ